MLHSFLFNLNWQKYKSLVESVIFKFYRNFNAINILNIVRVFESRKLRIYTCIELFLCSLFLIIFGNRFRKISIFILMSIKSTELINFFFSIEKNKLLNLIDFPFREEIIFAISYLKTDIYAFSAAVLILGFIFTVCINFIFKYSKFYGSFLTVLMSYFLQLYQTDDIYSEIVFYLLIFIISHFLFRFIEHIFFIKITILTGLILFFDTVRLLLKLIFPTFDFHEKITLESLIYENYKIFYIIFIVLIFIQFVISWRFLRKSKF